MEAVKNLLSSENSQQTNKALKAYQNNFQMVQGLTKLPNKRVRGHIKTNRTTPTPHLVMTGKNQEQWPKPVNHHRSRYDENARHLSQNNGNNNNNNQQQQQQIGSNKKNDEYFRRTAQRLVSSSLKPNESPLLAINISSKPLIYKQDGIGGDVHRLAASTESGMEEMRQSNTYEDKLPLVHMKGAAAALTTTKGSNRQMQKALRSNPGGAADTLNFRSSSKYASQSRKNSQEPPTTTTACTRQTAVSNLQTTNQQSMQTTLTKTFQTYSEQKSVVSSHKNRNHGDHLSAIKEQNQAKIKDHQTNQPTSTAILTDVSFRWPRLNPTVDVLGDQQSQHTKPVVDDVFPSQPHSQTNSNTMLQKRRIFALDSEMSQQKMPEQSSNGEIRSIYNKVEIQPFPKALGQTTKSFFNVDQVDQQVMRRPEKKPTRGEYPVLQTAKREQYPNNFYHNKQSTTATSGGVATKRATTRNHVQKKFKMNNSLHRQINKGSHFEIPSSQRMNSLKAANVIFTTRDPSMIDQVIIRSVKDKRYDRAMMGQLVQMQRAKIAFTQMDAMQTYTSTQLDETYSTAMGALNNQNGSGAGTPAAMMLHSNLHSVRHKEEENAEYIGVNLTAEGRQSITTGVYTNDKNGYSPGGTAPPQSSIGKTELTSGLDLHGTTTNQDITNHDLSLSPLPVPTSNSRGCSELRPNDSLFHHTSVQQDPNMLDFSTQKQHQEGGSLAITVPNMHELGGNQTPQAYPQHMSSLVHREHQRHQHQGSMTKARIPAKESIAVLSQHKDPFDTEITHVDIHQVKLPKQSHSRMKLGRTGPGSDEASAVDTKQLLKQNEESLAYYTGQKKQSQKSRHQELSHVNESEPLTEHDIKINEQVNKVLERVKHIQTIVRGKPTSVTRMQFLHQLEDAYGFQGYMHLDPSAKGRSSRSILEQKSKTLLSNNEMGQLDQISTFPMTKRHMKGSLFDTDLSAFRQKQKNTTELSQSPSKPRSNVGSPFKKQSLKKNNHSGFDSINGISSFLGANKSSSVDRSKRSLESSKVTNKKTSIEAGGASQLLTGKSFTIRTESSVPEIKLIEMENGEEKKGEMSATEYEHSTELADVQRQRSLLENQVVMNWLRNLARSPKKEKHLKDKYYRRTSEINADKQITEMFIKLDADGSNAISMDEMQELFLENGLTMTTEEVAEMFSIVKKINDSEWLNKAAARQAFVPKKPYVQTIADKLKLQMSMKDFKMVTEKPEALRQLNRVLLEHRDMMRAQNNFKFIPVTIDELMFRFCLNEKRKECEQIWNEGTKTLLKKNIMKLTDEEIYNFVDNSLTAMSRMIGEDNSDFSRFRNEQNSIYLKLLEQGSCNPARRTSLLKGTEQQ